MGIQLSHTTPYSKEENGIVERANKEVLRHLRNLVASLKSFDNWSTALVPIIRRIVNSSIHSAIGVSPAEIIFGKSVNLHANLMFSESRLQLGENVSNWIQQLSQIQEDILRAANQHQDNVDYNNLSKRTSEDHTITNFSVGTYVLVAPDPHSSVGVSKLNLKWRGPFQIIQNTSPSYVIKDLVDNHQETLHITRLKQYFHDPRNYNLLDIAMIDNREFEIHGYIGARKSLDFLVEWKNLPDSENRWIPWDEIYTSSILHDYLRSKKLARLIPSRLRSSTSISTDSTSEHNMTDMSNTESIPDIVSNSEVTNSDICITSSSDPTSVPVQSDTNVSRKRGRPRATSTVIRKRRPSQKHPF